MITGAIIGRQALIAQIAASGPAIKARVDAEVEKLGLWFEGKVKAEKLSGQVLKVRTGLLRSSISRGGPQSISAFEKDATSATYTIGTAVKYGAVHEYGFDGLVTVRPYVRHTYAVSYKALPASVRRKMGDPNAKRRVLGNVTGYAYVNGFIRHMRMPERSYLRSTLTENQAFIVERIRIAASAGLAQAMGQ